MVTIANGKLTFSRDQVVSASRASKNFGEMRRRARQNPLYVSDRNDGIDTVIVSYDEFEEMALELSRLQDEQFYHIAAERVAAADSDAGHQSISLEATIGSSAYAALAQEDTETISDEELFA